MAPKSRQLWRSAKGRVMAERVTTGAQLTWKRELVFEAASGTQTFAIDGNAAEGPSPMQLLAVALAGCMASDVVVILVKGRHEVRALRAAFTGVRAPEPPRKFEEIAIRFSIDTSAPADAIERAIALSREKYCSVWHSMREAIRLEVTYEIVGSRQ